MLFFFYSMNFTIYPTPIELSPILLPIIAGIGYDLIFFAPGVIFYNFSSMIGKYAEDFVIYKINGMTSESSVSVSYI